MTGLRYEYWRHGFIGKIEPHPLRRIQAMIRARAAEADAIERRLILCDIRADVETIHGTIDD